MDANLKNGQTFKWNQNFKSKTNWIFEACVTDIATKYEKFFFKQSYD